MGTYGTNGASGATGYLISGRFCFGERKSEKGRGDGLGLREKEDTRKARGGRLSVTW